MHKGKDGKVYASLTEVKNKTGDIFAIVDEFGEISISSYNKVRYKIVKVDINSVIDLSGEGEDKTSKVQKGTLIKATKTQPVELKHENPEVKEMQEVKEEHHTPALQQLIENHVPEIVEEAPALLNKTINIDVWNRDGRDEKDFIKESLQPLIAA